MQFSRWMLLMSVATFFRDAPPISSWDACMARLCVGRVQHQQRRSQHDHGGIVQSINRALMPSFAKIETGPALVEAVPQRHERAGGGVYADGSGHFAVAPYLVPVMLGRQWLMATPLLEILAFNGLALLFMSSMGSVLISRGVQAAVGRYNLFHVMLQVPLLLYLGHRFGARGIAIAVLSTSALMLPLHVALMSRKLGIGFGVFCARGDPAGARRGDHDRGRATVVARVRREHERGGWRAGWRQVSRWALRAISSWC